MTAVQAPGRARSFDRWKRREFTLAAGQHVYQGGRAAIDLQIGKVVAVTSDPGLFIIGSFEREYDATLAERKASVDLGMEIELEWLDNDTGPGALAAKDVGHVCYAKDDQTVSVDGAGRSIAGRVWEVDTATGLVAVQKLDGVALDGGGTGGGGIALPAFTTNNIQIGDVQETLNGALFDVPATSAASTITLPAAAPDGTQLKISADGVKNAHTVQYRDETGPVAITTALTAAKRHLVVLAKVAGTWRANAYVSP